MSQSRLGSITESVLNVGSGFVISYLLMAYVISPLYDLELKPQNNFTITAIFTVVSITRTYLWRRYYATKK